MIALVKKDFLLMKDQLGILLVQLLFILILMSANLRIFGYIVFVLAAVWSLLMTTMEKDKLSKAVGLLIATPYSRKGLVAAKYSCVACIYVLCTLAYTAIAWISKPIGIFVMPTAGDIIVAFFATCMFAGVTIPLYLCFDGMTVRLISILLILGGVFLTYTLGLYHVFPLELRLPCWLIDGISCSVSVSIMWLSYMVSCHFIRQKQY